MSLSNSRRAENRILVTSASSRRNRERALLLGLLLFCSCACFDQGRGWNQDSRFDLTRAIVERHTLRIDAYHANTFDKAYFNGHYHSDKAPGLSLLAIPVWAADFVVERAAGRDGRASLVPLLILWALGALAWAALQRSARAEPAGCTAVAETTKAGAYR